MKIIKVSIIIVLLFFLLFATPENSLPTELKEFEITLYTETVAIPLGGLINLDGTPFNSLLLQNKYIFLNIGTTWCPYCAKEKDSIQKLYSDYSSNKFSVLSVFLGEDPIVVQDYMNQHHYTFPVAIDKNNSLREMYAPLIPTTYLLTSQGLVLARIIDNREWVSARAIRILNHLMPEVHLPINNKE
jgi:thiol-disulfide isomerase/thioredoxin